MDWDPGASYSIISSEMWEKIGKPFLTKPPKLKAYCNFKLSTLRGKTDVQVTIDETTKILPVVVIDNADPMIFGLEWSEAFGMPFPKQVYSISANELVKDALDTNKQLNKQLEQIIEENVELFNSSLGKIKNCQVKLHIKENAKPIHIAARPIKFGIQKNVEAELERLVKQGTILPVDPNKTPIEWATPTVNVPKKDGGIQICGDFRTIISPVLIVEKHPVPLFDQLRRQLGNGLAYSKIDLKNAYLQFEVEEASRKYLIISTHKGYFKYNRLPNHFNTQGLFQVQSITIRNCKCTSIILSLHRKSFEWH
ncbi:hypothetical protein QE152_g32437 [Popillia japonica]|uniref:Uncharacterized protein n=1 Tax=Popillia japonica TaxID=7064 RepID=A0AAW1IZ15_POPJA